MEKSFYTQPIINSPYHAPEKHWELDEEGKPTQYTKDGRREAQFITPIPRPKKKLNVQREISFHDIEHLSTMEQAYAETARLINSIRSQVCKWRAAPEREWKVTAQTAELLKHWRHYEFTQQRPFYCQVEAVETIIWLCEVAPKIGQTGKNFLEQLTQAQAEANPLLLRMALKLATGAGKTTVMAMLIAWQTINAVHHPQSKIYTRGFLVVAPGITIRDRLLLLKPNDPNSYYVARELVPVSMRVDLAKAKIVITNYHSFMLRNRLDISSGGKRLLEGRSGEKIDTLESPGQMMQRVMPELMGLKSIMVLNDEAHHCYRAKASDENISTEEKKEIEENNKAARVWITGLEAVQEKIGISRVIDLSATPFFLRGSGYAEGTLFPWTVVDFSLMDAIECGIVKLPRIPVADNTIHDLPIYRNLWEHIRDDMPKQARSKKNLDPNKLPDKLKMALETLYLHYEKTFSLWQEHNITVPPCFIIVCNNTTSSKLVYDYISGFERDLADGSKILEPAKFALFNNFDSEGKRLNRPRTLLIDSYALETAEKLDDEFLHAAEEEINIFKREIIARTNDHHKAANISDSDILREVMNTVGKTGKLGESIRCVVSVSMLTEGWDANTVTHILGVRAFSTQLLCEQVIGRALRRQSYDLDERGLFHTEYADIFGVPFNFADQPKIATPQTPRPVVHIHAVQPTQDASEIIFPRVVSYRRSLSEEKLEAQFSEDSYFYLNPETTQSIITDNAGIVGEKETFSPPVPDDMRAQSIIYELTQQVLNKYHRDGEDLPKLFLFGQIKAITQIWFDNYLRVSGGSKPAELLMRDSLMQVACEKIERAIQSKAAQDNNQLIAVLDPYNPQGSTREINFSTTKNTLYTAAPDKCHVNYIVCDSSWEAEFCRIAESHPRVLAYIKNQGLEFTVPYTYAGLAHRYYPDFILHIDIGRAEKLNLIVEIKGERDDKDRAKSETIRNSWLPSINARGDYGLWDFAEFRSVVDMNEDFKNYIADIVEKYARKK